VDIGGAQRDALFEDVRAFVGERVDAALDDFLIADRTGLVAHLAAEIDEHALHLRVRDRLAAPRLVAVPAPPALLPVPAFLRDAVGELAVDEIGPFPRAALPDLPADVVARHVVHGEWAHRQSPFGERAVYLRRRRA